MKKILSLLLPALFLMSCDKRELPVPPGDIIYTQLEMGSDYRNQIWFSLYNNKVVSTNLRTAWDLGFEASPAGTHIFLNGSNAMKAFKTKFTTLSEVMDTVGLGSGGKADMPSGNIDSTAIGNWKSEGKVYVINRGYTPMGQQRGFYKLKIISENASAYTFEYASIKSTEVKLGTVNKNDAYNFVAFSFDSNSQLNIEPKKTDFDLCFTQYTHLFHEPLQYYQVTGALSNSYNTKVAKIKDKKFDAITISDTALYKFDSRRDKVGYDWKEFDLDNNLYKIDINMCYLIRDHKGIYYKLHFIDFLKAGVKGYPTFEFKSL